MNKFHQQLRKHSAWYDFWHNEPHHQKLHWLLFGMVAVFLALLIILRITGTGPTGLFSSAGAQQITLNANQPKVVQNLTLVYIPQFDTRPGKVKIQQDNVIIKAIYEGAAEQITLVRGRTQGIFNNNFTLTYDKKISATAITVTVVSKVSVPPPIIPPASLDLNAKGVTFFYLDGVAQDFPWVLENQDRPEVQAKLHALFKDYKLAGVNWIRILVARGHHPYFEGSLSSPPLFIEKMNKFLELTREEVVVNAVNKGSFKTEVVFVTLDGTALFADPAPYNRDKNWLEVWMNGLNHSNIGMVLIGGDLQPCSWGAPGQGIVCSPNGSQIANNHGAWLTNVWPWFKQKWPNVTASYEVISGNATTTELIEKHAAWMTANTPDIPVLPMSLYFDLAPGSSWQQYANWTSQLLQAHHRNTTKPLWIDEYGGGISATMSEADQAAFYNGFLAASTCWTGKQYSKFAWIAGNDYPYSGQVWAGLVRKYNNNIPEWRPAWSALSQYYNLQQCPQ